MCFSFSIVIFQIVSFAVADASLYRRETSAEEFRRRAQAEWEAKVSLLSPEAQSAAQAIHDTIEDPEVNTTELRRSKIASLVAELPAKVRTELASLKPARLPIS